MRDTECWPKEEAIRSQALHNKSQYTTVSSGGKHTFQITEQPELANFTMSRTPHLQVSIASLSHVGMALPHFSSHFHFYYLHINFNFGF